MRHFESTVAQNICRTSTNKMKSSVGTTSTNQHVAPEQGVWYECLDIFKCEMRALLDL
jgi:hypothetical protein